MLAVLATLDFHQIISSAGFSNLNCQIHEGNGVRGLDAVTTSGILFDFRTKLEGHMQ